MYNFDTHLVNLGYEADSGVYVNLKCMRDEKKGVFLHAGKVG